MRISMCVLSGAITFALAVALGDPAAAFQKNEKKAIESPSVVEADTKTAAPLVIIEKVGDAINGYDTVKIGQVIAIKLKTDCNMRSFDALFINGFRVRSSYLDTADVEKTIYYEINSRVVEVLERFMERSSMTRSKVPVSISLGSSDPDAKNPLTTSQVFFIEVKPRISNIYVFVLITLGALGMIALALYKDVLKDDNNLYYSLGRTQLFYWTVLFVAGYIYIWFKTDVLPDLTASMLVILGISISTTALGKVVENNTKAKVQIEAAAKSEGWFIDILSDSSSINIQRFQSVLFNFVFGGIFLQRCISNHALPEFDNNVLILMGMSSSTYAGLKVTEPLKEQREPLPVTGDDDESEGEGEKKVQATVSVG